MSYKVLGFKNGKKVGLLRDHTEKVMVFRTRKGAETTAAIEATQIENLGIDCKIVRIKPKVSKK